MFFMVCSMYEEARGHRPYRDSGNIVGLPTSRRSECAPVLLAPENYVRVESSGIVISVIRPIVTGQVSQVLT